MKHNTYSEFKSIEDVRIREQQEDYAEFYEQEVERSKWESSDSKAVQSSDSPDPTNSINKKNWKELKK